jgi:hypothetical protein
MAIVSEFVGCQPCKFGGRKAKGELRKPGECIKYGYAPIR